MCDFHFLETKVLEDLDIVAGILYFFISSEQHYLVSLYPIL